VSDVPPLHRLTFIIQSCRTACAPYIRQRFSYWFAYLFAGIYCITPTRERRQSDNIVYDDIVIAYSGSGKDSRLESALRGPMRSMLAADEISPIIGWVQEGADRAKYEQAIKPLIDKAARYAMTAATRTFQTCSLR